MTDQHQVANWHMDTGRITFHPPREIVRRERGPAERMAVLEEAGRSVRVTEGHWMIHRAADGAWSKDHARDLTGTPHHYPTSGRAQPHKGTTPLRGTIEQLWNLDQVDFETCLKHLPHADATYPPAVIGDKHHLDALQAVAELHEAGGDRVRSILRFGLKLLAVLVRQGRRDHRAFGFQSTSLSSQELRRASGAPYGSR